jgi:hypothetical protein
MLTTAWTSRPTPGRTLFVAFAYHGADRDATPHGLLERFESPAARGHRILHRDHYANPRTLPYVIALIEEAASVLSAGAGADLVIDSRYQAMPPEEITRGFGRIWSADLASAGPWRAELLPHVAGYAHVVLVYPDALGLGCETGERLVLDAHASVFVLNGRRRLFRVDSSLAMRLQFSRFLARTRVVERMLAAIIGPVAGVLARRDRAEGRQS